MMQAEIDRDRSTIRLGTAAVDKLEAAPIVLGLIWSLSLTFVSLIVDDFKGFIPDPDGVLRWVDEMRGESRTFISERWPRQSTPVESEESSSDAI